MAKEKDRIRVLVGNNIRRYRRLQSLSQEQLAELINISVSSLSNLERGNAYPNTDTLEKIIAALNIRLEMLFADEENKLNIEEDYKRRFNLIKKDPEKFNMLYQFIKIIT